MKKLIHAVAGALVAAVLVSPAAADARPAGHAARGGLEPNLSNLHMTYPAIHAVGAKGTHLPAKTHLLLTLTADALVRVKLRDTNPYGLRRAFNVQLPAGDSAVAITARVDGTSMPPGKYDVVVKAHNSAGSSDRFKLRLRIVGTKG